MEDLAAFHGHLGPYIVLGYRIGRYAKRYFCDDPFHMSAAVYCSGTPPQSCLADGVQLGSGCTLGKRNLDLITSDNVKCEFTSDGKKLVIRPKPFFIDRTDDGHYFERVEATAIGMYRMDDAELFEVSKN